MFHVSGTEIQLLMMSRLDTILKAWIANDSNIKTKNQPVPHICTESVIFYQNKDSLFRFAFLSVIKRSKLQRMFIYLRLNLKIYLDNLLRAVFRSKTELIVLSAFCDFGRFCCWPPLFCAL